MDGLRDEKKERGGREGGGGEKRVGGQREVVQQKAKEESGGRKNKNRLVCVSRETKGVEGLQSSVCPFIQDLVYPQLIS